MTSQPSVTITGTVIGPSLKIPTISDLTFSCSDPDVICQISGLTYSLTGQFSEQGLVTLNYGFTVTNPNLVTVSVTFSGGFTSSPPPPPVQEGLHLQGQRPQEAQPQGGAKL